MDRFDGKVVVTGAGAGFGEAISRAFAAEGAAVVLSDVGADSGAVVADSIKESGKIASGIPLGRLATPQDVVAAVLFLSTDDAGFLTGLCLPVDGGRSIS